MSGILKSNRYRYLRGGVFPSVILTSMFSAFMSLIAVKLIAKYALELPSESFSVLYSNGYYNFGVLKVENVQDLANLSIEQVVSSAFAGGFLALVLAIFIPMFICGSFKGGFIQNAFVRGNSKGSILGAYVISSLEVFAALFIAYILSLLISSSLVMGVSVSGDSLFRCMGVFVREILAHFVFLCVCIAISFIVNKTSSCIVALIFSVIAFPGLFNTMDLILQKDLKLSYLWIVNIIGTWSVPDPANFALGLGAAALTLVLSTGTALILFVFSDLKQ